MTVRSSSLIRNLLSSHLSYELNKLTFFKAAEERRKEMRRMMAERKKQAKKLATSESSPALIQVSCSTIPEEGGTASVLTEKQNTIQNTSEDPPSIL